MHRCSGGLGPRRILRFGPRGWWRRWRAVNLLDRSARGRDGRGGRSTFYSFLANFIQCYDILGPVQKINGVPGTGAPRGFSFPSQPSPSIMMYQPIGYIVQPRRIEKSAVFSADERMDEGRGGSTSNTSAEIGRLLSQRFTANESKCSVRDR